MFQEIVYKLCAIYSVQFYVHSSILNSWSVFSRHFLPVGEFIES